MDMPVRDSSLRSKNGAEDAQCLSQSTITPTAELLEFRKRVLDLLLDTPRFEIKSGGIGQGVKDLQDEVLGYIKSSYLRTALDSNLNKDQA